MTRLGPHLLTLAFFAYIVTAHRPVVSSDHVLLKSGDTDAMLLQTKSSKARTAGVASQVPGGAVTVRRKGWFERMSQALWSVVFGIVLVLFSIVMVWIGERQAARMEALIEVGQADCVDVGAEPADAANCGKLILARGAEARGCTPLWDERFPNVGSERGLLRLRSTVEVFQWHEIASSNERKDSVGGGTTTTTEYRYETRWSSGRQESNTFKVPTYTNTYPVNGLDLGQMSTTSSYVEYGKGFTLPEDLLGQLANWKTEIGGGSLVKGDTIEFKSHVFRSAGEYFYYAADQAKVAGDSPQVGDTRVLLEYILDQPLSVLALQTEGAALPEGQSDEGAFSFIPYRAIHRGFFCKINKEQEAELLLQEGRKSASEIYDEDRWSCGCLCCCCNAATFLFSMAPPQLYHLMEGSPSANDFWQQVEFTSSLKKWGIRFLGCLMLAVGFSGIFKPIEVLLDVIPFIGPYLGTGASYALGFLSFLMAILVCTFVCFTAWLVYHPLAAILFAAIVGLLCGMEHLRRARALA